MLKFLYPFKKKIKISLVDTDESLEIKELKKSYKQSLEELYIERKNYLLILINNYINKKLKELEYIEKPFRVGDFVVVDYYGESYYNALASSGLDLVKNFPDIPDLRRPLKIKAIFPYTQFLEHTFCVSKGNNGYNFYTESDKIYDIIRSSTSISTLEYKFNDYIKALELRHKNTVEWAIDFDWEYHKFRDGDFKVSWGGFSPSTFYRHDCYEGQIQLSLLEEEKRIESLYVSYNDSLNEYREKINKFKKSITND